MNILICAWECPGFHSRQGTALVQRIGQLIRGFSKSEHLVTIIHRDHLNELHSKEDFQITKETTDGSRFTRISVKGPPTSPFYWAERFSIFRMLFTWHRLFWNGDRSGVWAKKAFKRIKDKIEVPDLILSVFTPRGPLLLGSLLSQHLSKPLIFDFKDNWDIGLTRFQRFLSKMWMRTIVKNADACVHVSPDWAERDGKVLGTKFKTIRHAVPAITVGAPDKAKRNNFRILYAGSLNINKQDTRGFIDALKDCHDEGKMIEFHFAGDPVIGNFFLKQLPPETFKYMGWLGQKDLFRLIPKYDCFALFGWKDAERQVVPSKLFEYMAFKKPILLVGHDSGGLKNLLSEWEHPMVIHDTTEAIHEALLQGINSDCSAYLLPERCKNVLTEEMMIDEIIRTINQVLKSKSQRTKRSKVSNHT